MARRRTNDINKPQKINYCSFCRAMFEKTTPLNSEEMNQLIFCRCIRSLKIKKIKPKNVTQNFSYEDLLTKMEDNYYYGEIQ